jgi:protoporphyrinogen oxidase
VVVAGAAIDGVGIPACIASAGRAVADLLASHNESEGRIRA